MKESIHPKCEPITINCTCGNQIKTVSTICKDISVELCSNCHPFFTGKQRLIDTTGRVERYQKRMDKFQELKNASSKSKR